MTDSKILKTFFYFGHVVFVITPFPTAPEKERLNKEDNPLEYPHGCQYKYSLCRFESSNQEECQETIRIEINCIFT